MLMIDGLGNSIRGHSYRAHHRDEEAIVFYKHYLEAYCFPSHTVGVGIMLGLALLMIIMFRPQDLTPETPNEGLTTKINGKARFS